MGEDLALVEKGEYKNKQLFAKVPKDVIYRLYIIEQQSYRYICKELKISNHSVPILLDGYDIPIRHGSVAVATQWRKNPFRRYNQSRRFVHNIVSTFRNNPTPAEIKFQQILSDIGIDFTFQQPFKIFLLDFAIPSLKIAIEIDGKEHHQQRKLRESDRRRTAYLEKSGWRVLRFSNFEVVNESIKVQQQLDSIITRLQQ